MSFHEDRTAKLQIYLQLKVLEKLGIRKKEMEAYDMDAWVIFGSEWKEYKEMMKCRVAGRSLKDKGASDDQ